MKLSTCTAVVLASLALSVTGCPKKEDNASTDKSADSKKDKDKDKKKKKGDDDDDKGEKKTKKVGGGLADPSNDKDVVKAVKKVMAGCKDKWDDKKAYDDCDAPMKEFRDAKLEKVDETWLNIIDDDDVKVRSIGVLGLDIWGSSYRDDKKLANRTIDDLRNEKEGSITDAEMAYVVTEIYDDQFADHIKEVALDKGTTKDIKAVLAAWWHNDKGFDITKALESSKDPALRLAAVGGYALHYDKHGDEACKYWDAHLEDSDKDVRRYSVGHLTGGWSGNTTHDSDGSWYVTGGGGGPSDGPDDKDWCDSGQIDDALSNMDKRAGANTIDDDFYIYSLANLANVKNKHPSAAQRKKAVDVLHKIVETKGASQRSWALTKLVDADPSQKSYAAKFASDEDLKYTVADIMKPKK